MSYSQIRACTVCSAKNRIPARHLSSAGRCGSCKNTLAPAEHPINITNEADFEDIVSESTVPILVDFWAPWCGPCRQAAPEVEKLASQTSGRALAVKVNTDELPQLGARYGARAIPHFVVIHRGHVVSSKSGLVSAKEMASWLPPSSSN
jgi:thioredoxin 2